MICEVDWDWDWRDGSERRRGGAASEDRAGVSEEEGIVDAGEDEMEETRWRGGRGLRREGGGIGGMARVRVAGRVVTRP
jgi:hypothetical protein